MPLSGSWIYATNLFHKFKASNIVTLTTAITRKDYYIKKSRPLSLLYNVRLGPADFHLLVGSWRLGVISYVCVWLERSYDPPGGHPGLHAYTSVIHILSTSLISVSIFLSAVTLGINLDGRDVRIFDREKSLGQNTIGYNRSHGRNLSSASGQGEFIAQHFFNKIDH